MIRVERVTASLPAGFDTLREEARSQGYRMLDVLAAEWQSGKTRFDRDGEALLAGYDDTVLTGIGGLTIDPFVPGALRMRRFYVLSVYRRRGVARAITAALLTAAATDGRTITLNAGPASEAFWESLGFVPSRRERQTHILCAPV